MRITLYAFVLVVGASSPSSSAAELTGRVFSSASERTALEHLRENAKAIEMKPNMMSAPQPSEPASTPIVYQAPPPAPVTMQGFVTRSDGKKGTVWINQQAVREDSAGAAVHVGKIQGESAPVSIQLSNGRKVPLKAGQRYDAASGRFSGAVVQLEKSSATVPSPSHSE